MLGLLCKLRKDQRSRNASNDPRGVDVIVMDWNMPGMTAGEFMVQADTLKGQNSYRSNHWRVQLAEIAKNLNIKLWLQKPIEF